MIKQYMKNEEGWFESKYRILFILLKEIIRLGDDVLKIYWLWNIGYGRDMLTMPSSDTAWHRKVI